MERMPVSSSHLESVGYDANSATLDIEFKNGSLYRYYNVPQFEFDQLMSASSPGTYFNANIKNTYSYERA